MSSWLVVASCCAVLVGCADIRSGEPACAECTITRSVVAWIDGRIFEGQPLGAATTPQRHYIILEGRSAIEFNGQGEFVRRITGSPNNSAPGSFSSITAVGLDSLILSDDRAGLLRIVGFDRTQVDSVRLPENVRIRTLSVFQWPEQLVFAGYALGRNDVFRAEVSDGFLIINKAFETPKAPRAVRTPTYLLFKSGNDRLWAVESSSYNILEFDSNGLLINRVVRKPGWFARPGGRPSGRLLSTVTAISEDGQGRLWVYSARPTNKAASAWRSPDARRPGGVVSAGLEELYETVVEVLGPDGRVLLAHGTIAGDVVGVTADGRAVVYQRNSDGFSRVSVQELGLRETSKHGR